MTTLTDMNFLELGFNKNEAKTYLSLIKFKEAPASLIIKDTKFHKNIVYDNLEKLVNKGLVSYIQKDSKKHYKIENSQNLVEIFKQKKKTLKQKKN
jgi:sugar-specific transcriptional regulator TrmB